MSLRQHLFKTWKERGKIIKQIEPELLKVRELLKQDPANEYKKNVQDSAHHPWYKPHVGLDKLLLRLQEQYDLLGEYREEKGVRDPAVMREQGMVNVFATLTQGYRLKELTDQFMNILFHEGDATLKLVHFINDLKNKEPWNDKFADIIDYGYGQFLQSVHFTQAQLKDIIRALPRQDAKEKAQVSISGLDNNKWDVGTPLLVKFTTSAIARAQFQVRYITPETHQVLNREDKIQCPVHEVGQRLDMIFEVSYEVEGKPYSFPIEIRTVQTYVAPQRIDDTPVCWLKTSNKSTLDPNNVRSQTFQNLKIYCSSDIPRLKEDLVIEESVDKVELLLEGVENEVEVAAKIGQIPLGAATIAMTYPQAVIIDVKKIREYGSNEDQSLNLFFGQATPFILIVKRDSMSAPFVRLYHANRGFSDKLEAEFEFKGDGYMKLRAEQRYVIPDPIKFHLGPEDHMIISCEVEHDNDLLFTFEGRTIRFPSTVLQHHTASFILRGELLDDGELLIQNNGTRGRITVNKCDHSPNHDWLTALNGDAAVRSNKTFEEFDIGQSGSLPIRIETGLKKNKIDLVANEDVLYFSCDQSFSITCEGRTREGCEPHTVHILNLAELGVTTQTEVDIQTEDNRHGTFIVHRQSPTFKGEKPLPQVTGLHGEGSEHNPIIVDPKAKGILLRVQNIETSKLGWATQEWRFAKKQSFPSNNQLFQLPLDKIPDKMYIYEKRAIPFLVDTIHFRKEDLKIDDKWITSDYDPSQPSEIGKGYRDLEQVSIGGKLFFGPPGTLSENTMQPSPNLHHAKFGGEPYTFGYLKSPPGQIECTLTVGSQYFSLAVKNGDNNKLMLNVRFAEIEDLLNRYALTITDGAFSNTFRLTIGETQPTFDDFSESVTQAVTGNVTTARR